MPRGVHIKDIPISLIPDLSESFILSDKFQESLQLYDSLKVLLDASDIYDSESEFEQLKKLLTEMIIAKYFDKEREVPEAMDAVRETKIKLIGQLEIIKTIIESDLVLPKPTPRDTSEDYLPFFYIHKESNDEWDEIRRQNKERKMEFFSQQEPPQDSGNIFLDLQRVMKDIRRRTITMQGDSEYLSKMFEFLNMGDLVGLSQKIQQGKITSYEIDRSAFLDHLIEALIKALAMKYSGRENLFRFRGRVQYMKDPPAFEKILLSKYTVASKFENENLGIGGPLLNKLSVEDIKNFLEETNLMEDFVIIF